MTLTSLQTLASTDDGREQIRTMVAELRGDHTENHWWCPSCQREVSPTFVTYQETHDGCGALVESHEAKPYTTSRDACAEFEAGLRGKDVEWYQHHLERVVFKATTDDDWSEELGVSARTKVWHASVLHRCMAFILTKGADRE